MRGSYLMAAPAMAILGATIGVAPPAHPAPGALRLDVAERSIVPSTGLLHAGATRLTVRNLGFLEHEVRIVRTRRWGDTPHGPSVGAVLDVVPGAAASETIVLRRGSYAAVSTPADASIAFAVR